MKLIAKIIVFAGLYYPIIFIVLFYSFYIRAINKLGYKPVYNNPDPRELNFEFHRNLVYEVGDQLLISIIIYTIALLLFVFKKSFLQIKLVHFIISAMLFLVIFLTIISPIMEWFGD